MREVISEPQPKQSQMTGQPKQSNLFSSEPRHIFQTRNKMNKILAAQLRERFNQAEAEKHQLELKKKEEAIANAASRKAEIERTKREVHAAKIAMRHDQRKKQLILTTVKTAYLQILKTIIKGNPTTTMRMSQDIHPDELINYGIKAEQPKEAEEKLNKLQQTSLLELEELLRKEEADGTRLPRPALKIKPTLCEADEARLLRPAWKVMSTLTEVGVAAGIEFATAELTEIKNKAGAEITKLDKACGRLREDISAVKRKISLAEDAQAKQKVALEKKLAATKEKNQKAAQRAELLQQIANDIAPRMPTIANDFNIRHPNGQEVSVLTRVAFLRRSFANIDPKFNRADLSDLEIINIARIANGQDPLVDLTKAALGRYAPEDSTYNAKDVLQQSESLKQRFMREMHVLSQPESIEQRFTRKINEYNNELSNLNAQLVTSTQRINNLNKLIRKLNKASETIMTLANYAKATLDQVDSKSIRFIRGQYLSETIISLSTMPSDIESAVMSSHKELVWLSSADGKTFLEYLQVVLLELANKSQRTAKIAFAEGVNGTTELEVGGVKLSARLRKEPIMLIFKYFGLDTIEPTHTSKNDLIEVSW